MVYGTVGRPSVCLSVCLSVRPTIRLQPRHSVSLLLSAERARNVDRQRQAPGAHPQRRRSAGSSTALSSRREQCRVYSGRMKRYADLLLLPPLVTPLCGRRTRISVGDWRVHHRSSSRSISGGS